MDVIKSTLPRKENHELAEELLGRFPGVDRAELLSDLVSLCFFNLRYGIKREELAACEFLNELQRIAIRNQEHNHQQAVMKVPAIQTVNELPADFGNDEISKAMRPRTLKRFSLINTTMSHAFMREDVAGDWVMWSEIK